MLFYNVSAKTYLNLDKAFFDFAHRAVEYEKKYYSEYYQQGWVPPSLIIDDEPAKIGCYC